VWEVYIPEEVLTTEKPAVTREALVSQRTAAFAALDALGVPDSVENVQQEPVKDRTVAAGTQQQHPGAGGCAVGDVGAGVDGVAVDSSRGRNGRVAATRLHSVPDRQPAGSPASLRTTHAEIVKNNKTTFHCCRADLTYALTVRVLTFQINRLWLKLCLISDHRTLLA